MHWSSTLLLCGVIATGFSTDARATTAPPSHAAIRYVGRWDHGQQDAPWCAWQGSSFAVPFQGTALAAVLECDRAEFVRVVVDGASADSRKLALRPGKHRYVLADELSPGAHHLELVKETYSGRGRLTLHGLEVESGQLLVASKARAKMQHPPRLRLQFYGDSNLAGYSLEHERNRRDLKYQGCHFTFAGIVARMLGASYQNISVSGAGILGRDNSVLNFYDRMDYYTPDPKWDFRRFPVDVCVVNIGANDINRSTKAEIKENYKVLLRALRTVHPAAHIVVMNGYGWDRNEPANYTQEVVRELADDNMSRLVFPWLFNEWHGCEYDHAGMAAYLADHLSKINPAWKPIRKSDVLDGFGAAGDVANGSFESVAPFGGFGWRYLEDGAKRQRCKASPDGQWFLRLPAGKQVHQPCGARSGGRYRYKLWLRSPAHAKVTLRTEFRDQAWRHEIQGSGKTLDVPLGPDWREVEIEVAAPPKTGDPSRDVWQIILHILAGEGTVDCDHIRLSEVDG